jgi:hypothetical protein
MHIKHLDIIYHIIIISCLIVFYPKVYNVLNIKFDDVGWLKTLMLQLFSIALVGYFLVFLNDINVINFY